jgi:hypothetical protein
LEAATAAVTGGKFESDFKRVTSYSGSDLMPCITDMYRIVCGAPTAQLQAVQKKYKERILKNSVPLEKLLLLAAQ